MGRSRGGLSTKIHARVDHQGRAIQILITPGQAHDLTGAEPLLANLGQDTIIIADKAYDADHLRAHIKARGAIANIPNMIRRKSASAGPKPSIASATTLNASSTSSSSSVVSLPAATSSAGPSWLSFNSQPCESRSA